MAGALCEEHVPNERPVGLRIRQPHELPKAVLLPHCIGERQRLAGLRSHEIERAHDVDVGLGRAERIDVRTDEVAHVRLGKAVLATFSIRVVVGLRRLAEQTAEPQGFA